MRNANHWSNRVYKAQLVGQSVERMVRCDHKASVMYVPEFAAEGADDPYVCASCGARLTRSQLDAANAALRSQEAK
jgi:hypothetical protein